jgi:hypothetical protein
MRFEVARLFSIHPASILALPLTEYRKYTAYYMLVKRKEREALQGDEPEV